MESLFWKAVHRERRGYVEGWEPGYGRFAVIDDRRGRIFAFTPVPVLEHLEIRTVRNKGEWCLDHVARLAGERV